MLWTYTYDDSPDMLFIGAFILRLARKFSLKGKFTIPFAHTCSRLQTDGFGGGAILLDFDRDDGFIADHFKSVSNRTDVIRLDDHQIYQPIRKAYPDLFK